MNRLLTAKLRALTNTVTAKKTPQLLPTKFTEHRKVSIFFILFISPVVLRYNAYYHSYGEGKKCVEICTSKLYVVSYKHKSVCTSFAKKRLSDRAECNLCTSVNSGIILERPKIIGNNHRHS